MKFCCRIIPYQLKNYFLDSDSELFYNTPISGIYITSCVNDCNGRTSYKLKIVDPQSNLHTPYSKYVWKL